MAVTNTAINLMDLSVASWWFFDVGWIR